MWRSHVLTQLCCIKMIQIQYLASQLWSGSLLMMMIIITFDLKALCRSLYAFFLECVVCFCYLYYIIMMIISVWQRDTSCFHWYILLHIKLWNLLLFCYGWICRVVLHDNLLCCTVIFFFLLRFAPPAAPLSHSQGSNKRLSQIVNFLATTNSLHLWFLNMLNRQSLLF